MIKKFVLFIVLVSFFYSYGKEVKLNPEVEKKFGIKTIQIKKEDVYDKEEYPGVVIEDPTKTVLISSPVEGVIDALFVKKGSFVKKGQVVATVVSPEINQILSQIEVAKVKVQTTKNILDRDQLLYKEEVIPYSRYFSSKVEYENAVANLKALEKTLLSYGNVKNGKLLITSKVSGVVLDISAFVGSSVSVGKEIGKIADLSEVLVITQVPPEKVKNIKLNDDAIIVSQDNQEFKGKVILIDYQLNPQTRRNEVRVIVKNSGYTLKPNMFVNVRFLKIQESGFVVPKAAVIVSSYKNYVIVKENGVYKLRNVVLGKSADDKVNVLSGLKEGEEVVVSGVNLLKKELLEEEK
ncbi:efflux RND transporter periplasmic adaptor subunit [Sulfurihydrogenibium sp.]|uniref:efflux RND transporter periplasmic adaptor subunit n=1 Tax=Sulfurihydrogenibium sp. TaxID=2053621 RepID=UPI00262F6C2A|nr:efflux RND transporter periplasmic adaptor subunit [Sulfurihydrogenibium sp.]